MIFTCPSCHKQHRLPEGMTPPPGSATNCKNCGIRFPLDEPGKEPLVQEPPSSRSRHKRAEEEIHSTIYPQTISRPTATILDAFPELQDLPLENFLPDEIFFTGTGELYSARLNHLLVKLLVATAPLSSEKILNKDEQVYRIASGIAYFPSEIPYANGLLTWPMNYYALICTNYRLIFINLDCRLSRPNRYVFQIPYDNITGVSRGLYGSSLITITKAGQTWDFTTVNRRLATSMERFIREKSGSFNAVGTETIEPSQLCPACYRPVPKKTDSCSQCLTHYKSVVIAQKKSLLLPGLGNIYLSNRYLGMIEILGYMFTWFMAIVLVIIGIPGGIWGGGLLVMFYHLGSGFMAGKMAERGHLPVDNNPEKSTHFFGFARKYPKKTHVFTRVLQFQR